MDQRYLHRVTPALAPYVTRAEGYRHTGLQPGVHHGLPSGALTFILPIDEPLRVSASEDSSATEYQTALLSGLHVRPAIVHHGSVQHGIQLAIHPSGARALFGIPAGGLEPAGGELADVIGAVVTELSERVQAQTSWPARFAVLEQFLLGRLDDVRRPRPEVAHAWRLLRRSGGRLPIQQLAGSVGWSRRHLEQQFAAEFGITPKVAARVIRFERAVSLVKSRAGSLADVAADAGYADQAHLSRDWHSFVGLSPTAWRSNDVLAFVQDQTSPAPAHSRHDNQPH